MRAISASSPRYVRFGSLEIKNEVSRVYRASSNSSVSSFNWVANIYFMISYSTLFARGFLSMSLNLSESLGSNLDSTLLISQRSLISLIKSQLERVFIISNKVGIVTRKSFGLSIVIFWIDVTAEIWTLWSGSCNLSARYGTSLTVESGQWSTNL